ncbi:MAG: hypothetical protein M3530_02650, partial [Thermoproteota archaeon]|nr:hypothetical protein [Thermoproteota archaeon]
MLLKMIALVSLFALAVVLTIIPLTYVNAIGNRCTTVWQRSEGIHLCIGTELNDHIDGSKAPDIVIGLA